MKKIVLILLAGALLLSAVEWDKNPISDTPMHLQINPVLVLDAQGYARVLYIELNFDTEEARLKLASNATGSWDIREVASLSNYYYEYDLYYLQTHSLDVDSKGNTYVAFFDLTSEDISNLFLATDTSGEFLVDKLTDDSFIQVAPIMQIGVSDEITFTYIEADPEDESFELRYGWLDEGNFNSEPITDNIYQEGGFLPIDFVLDKDDVPHIFYTGSDYYLWHAEPSLSHLQDWNTEHVTSIPYAITPSAAWDAAGNLHVAYRSGEMDMDSLMYATDKSGAWQEELVTRTGEPFFDWYDVPSISLNPQGRPYIVWGCYWEDSWAYGLRYSAETATGWFNEDISDTLGSDEFPAMGHYFAIDSEGYGHLVYATEGESSWPVYYAKSKEPFIEAIAEQPVEPNPFALEVRGSAVHFSLPQSGNIYLDLYDVAGRHVDHLVSGTYASGEHVVPISVSELAAGVYFVRIEAGRQSASAKFVVTH